MIAASPIASAYQINSRASKTISMHDRPRKFRVFMLILFLPLFFSIARYIPAASWSLELGIILSIATAMFANAGRKMANTPYDTYIFVTAFGLPLVAATSAYLTFGQPILYGLAAQRGCLMALFALGAWRLIANGRLTLRELNAALVILSWISLSVSVPIYLFIDANKYRDLGSLVSDGGGAYNEWQLPAVFVIFGAIHYLSVSALNDKIKPALFSLPFILYLILFHQGRIVILSLFAGIVVIAILGNPRRRLASVLTALSLLISVVAVSYLAMPEKFSSLVSRFIDAIAAALGAYEVSDISANVRILQAEIAWPYILSNPIMGTGVVSNQWQGGYQQIFGYFHPSDMGPIGILFVYGIAGLLFFSIQYIIVFKMIEKINFSVIYAPDRVIILSLFGFLVTMLISALFDGSFLLVPEQSVLLVAILLAALTRKESGLRQR